MAYDPIKAHEYYEKYVKKGLRKGRKKGSSKSSSKKKGSSKKASAKKTSLTGVSTSGLNDAGKIEAAFTKEKITKEMNEALAKETTDEGKEKVRREYSLKAQEAMNKLKSDPKYAQAKKASSKGAKSSKSGSSGGSKGSSKSETSSKGSTKKAEIRSVAATKAPKSSGGKGTGIVAAKTTTKTATLTEAQKQERQALVDNVNDLTKQFKDKIGNMTAEEKADAKRKLTKTVNEIRAKISKIKVT